MWDFDRPLLLLLIPAGCGVLWWAWRGSLARWTPAQAALCFALRALVVTFVALALADPRWLRFSDRPAVVFLRDNSASISAASAARAEKWIAAAEQSHPGLSAEVAFAQKPWVVRPFDTAKEKKPHSQIPAPAGSESAREGTDLGGALEFAAGLIPADRPGRIVLLSDGLATGTGNPLETAAGLKERGVEVDAIPLRAEPRADVAVASLKIPPAVREGEVFDIAAEVYSPVTLKSVPLRLYQNNLLVAELRRDLSPGMNTVSFPNIRAEGRMALYDVEAAAPADPVAENNRRRLAVAHAGAARVLVVDREPSQAEPLAEVLRRDGFSVEVRPPQGLPDGLDELENFDLLIFAGAPALDFSDSQMEMVEHWVKDFGGGFLMIGGPDSFGAGGYFKTAISRLLPVRIDREDREETPVVALLVILDRSGSMSAPAGSTTKISLADEGSAMALDVLQNKDLFGLFAVDTHVQEVVPLGKIVDRQGAARRIAGITAGGGGIYIYTSLAEAFPRLRDVQAKIKHIILFSDAADAEEKNGGEALDGEGGTGSSLDLAAAMLANRITLSVVALGTEQDKDTAFLRQLAAQGGGRFYLTADAGTLPRLFTIETMRAAESSVQEDAFFAQPLAGQTVAKGISWPQSPVLLGFNITQPKPGAEVDLVTEKGDPLYAEWRYGLGKAAVFTSDAKSRWASEWLGWPGFGKFWGQVARELARAGNRGDLTVRLHEEGGELVVDADAVTADGKLRDGLKISVSLAAPGAEPLSAIADQVGPGLYRARLKTPDAESAIVAVSDGGGRPVSIAWTRDFPAEYLTISDGTPLLQKISALTGGRFQPKPEEAFRPVKTAIPSRTALAPLLLALAALLWPLDIWLRRRTWTGKSENSLPPFSPAN